MHVQENNKKTLVIKYGGNAMINENLKKEVVQVLCDLHRDGYKIVLVHGGGPYIKAALDRAGLESEFVAGQRVTDAEAIVHIEQVLKGQVGGQLVALIQENGYKAVGLSGKDGYMVMGEKRIYRQVTDTGTENVDMGFVADIKAVDTSLLDTLLAKDYIPVLSCLATDDKGVCYNVNGDMFAGHIAAAMQADYYIVLTNVDGLMTDVNDPSSKITELSLRELPKYYEDKTISGGMIPKMDSLKIARESGVESAFILNGAKPGNIIECLEGKTVGTKLI
jgi:acetylglutamate kinase